MIIQKMKILNEILDFVKNHKKVGLCFLRVNDSFFTCPDMGIRETLLYKKEDKHFSITKSSINSTDNIEIKFRIEYKIKEYDGLDDSYFCLAEPRDIVNWFISLNQEDLIELRDRFKSGKFSFMEKKQ